MRRDVARALFPPVDALDLLLGRRGRPDRDRRHHFEVPSANREGVPKFVKLTLKAHGHRALFHASIRLPSGYEDEGKKASEALRLLRRQLGLRPPSDIGVRVADDGIVHVLWEAGWWTRVRAILSRIRGEPGPPPLLIVGRPRSLTTHVYRCVCAATELESVDAPSRQPDQQGEILHPTFCYTAPAIRPYSDDPESYIKVKRILDHVGRGRAVKDVIEPYQVARYLRSLRGRRFNVLYVRRDPNEVQKHIDARMEEGAFYNRHVADTDRLYADRADATVEYDRLIYEPDHLWEALREMGYEVRHPFDYTQNPQFQQKRAEILGKRAERRAQPVQ